jgi:hypothetical protein
LISVGGSTTIQAFVSDYSNDFDVKVRVLNSLGVQIGVDDPSTSFDAALTLNLTAGQNECMIQNWNMGATATGVAMTLVQDQMDASHVTDAVRHIAALPLSANVLNMTVMASTMPFVGRG